MQSYEKQIWQCPNLSVFVGFCQFLSVFGTMLFLAAKLQKVNLALSVCVSLCHFVSLYVTFRYITSFTLQSYEKEIWHCPHLSAYVRICPEMSAFVRFRHSNVSYCRCKVTKKYFGIVTLVSPYA